MNTDFFDLHHQTPLTQANYKLKSGKRLSFQVKRDDLIHKQIAGNKWRKLKFNFQHFDADNYQGIASFGGAFSNHIAALSAAGHQADIKTLGFIRTHEIDNNNPTLKLACKHGMKLVAMSRIDYQLRHDGLFLQKLQKQYPEYYFVPEGGSNQQAALGLAELASELQSQGISAKHHVVACAIGSGGTISGLLDSFQDMHFIGVAAVNDVPLLTGLQKKYGERLTIVSDNLFGGYGRTNSTLNEFCLDFYQQTLIPIEPIYTGKLFHTLMHRYDELMGQNSKSLVVIHTGGLQGIKGLDYRHQFQSCQWKALLSLTDV